MSSAVVGSLLAPTRFSRQQSVKLKTLLLQTFGRMRLLSLTLLLLLGVAAVQCWWPWGGDEEEEVKEVEKEKEEEEGFREQLERDLAGVGQEVVFESDHPADSIKQEEGDLVEEKEEVKEEVKEEESLKEEAWESWKEEEERELSESDEANIAALLETPELARKLDRKAFEEKLDEVPLESTRFVFEAPITMYQFCGKVIKGHEATHAGKEAHFDEEGDKF